MERANGSGGIKEAGGKHRRVAVDQQRPTPSVVRAVRSARSLVEIERAEGQGAHPRDLGDMVLPVQARVALCREALPANEEAEGHRGDFAERRRGGGPRAAVLE